MKSLILTSLFAAVVPGTAMAFDSLAAQADYYQNLFSNPPSNTKIATGSMNKGETRPKAVLKGVYYFGGTDGRRTPLSSTYQGLLCHHGFSRAYSVYSQVDTQARCERNEVTYKYIGQAKHAADGGTKVAALMKQIYDVIKSNGQMGPIYLHCYYGVHASNTISQMVLKQFCGISDAQASSNWDKVNIYNSLREPGPTENKAKIAAYRVDPRLAITEAEKAVVCY